MNREPARHRPNDGPAERRPVFDSLLQAAIVWPLAYGLLVLLAVALLPDLEEFAAALLVSGVAVPGTIAWAVWREWQLPVPRWRRVCLFAFWVSLPAIIQVGGLILMLRASADV